MAAKRILQLGKFYYPARGGMESHLKNLCEGIQDRYELEVIVANDSLATNTELVNGVKVTRVGNLGEIRSNSLSPLMPLRINKNRPDIVHIHFPNPMAHLAYLLSGHKGKLIITWHSDIIKQVFLLKFYAPLLDKILQRADRVIVTSENYAAHSPFLCRCREKCVVIPLGVEVARFEKNDQREQEKREIKKRFARDRALILFVGRLTGYKGVHYLIEAMKHIDANLLIIGKGAEYNNLRSQIDKTNMRGDLFFLGEVEDDLLPAYYHACDLLVLPSTQRSEAFGIVQLEAFACGKPVVSTDLDTGVPFVNQHEKTGLIVPPKDPPALAKAINRLLASEQLRIQYGQNALKRVKQEFTVKKMVDDTVAVYENI